VSIDFIHPDLRSLALPIESLNEDPRNANQHNDASRKAIAASMIEFGQRKPIVVRCEGMIVEAGNGTLAALRAAGWTHLACVVCDDDEERATAYALADNQAARHASWNFDQLRVNVEETLAGYGDVFGQLWAGDEIAGILSGNVDSLAGSLQEHRDGGDHVPLGTGSDQDKPGAGVPTMRWGKRAVPLTEQEQAELERLFTEHMQVAGGPFGFIAGILGL
jgi:hypothetical protein